MFVLALTRISDPGRARAQRRRDAAQSCRSSPPRRAERRRTRRTPARSDSISAPNEPEISPRRTASATAATSSSPMYGSKTGITDGSDDDLVLLVAEERALLHGQRLEVLDHPDRVDSRGRGRSRRRARSRTTRKSRWSSVKSWTSTTPRWTTNICCRSSIVRHGLVVVRLLLVAGLVREQAELERGLGGREERRRLDVRPGPDDLCVRRATVLDDLESHCADILRSDPDARP